MEADADAAAAANNNNNSDADAAANNNIELDDCSLNNKTQDLHVGDWILHKTELGIMYKKKDMRVSKILRIDPKGTFKLLLNTGIGVPDDSLVAKVAIGDKGELTLLGGFMSLVESEPEEYGISFNLHTGGDATVEDVLRGIADEAQKMIDALNKHLDDTFENLYCEDDPVKTSDGPPVDVADREDDAPAAPLDILGTPDTSHETQNETRKRRAESSPCSSDGSPPMDNVDSREPTDETLLQTNDRHVAVSGGNYVVPMGTSKTMVENEHKSTSVPPIQTEVGAPVDLTLGIDDGSTKTRPLSVSFLLLDMNDFTIDVSPRESESYMHEVLTNVCCTIGVSYAVIPDDAGYDPYAKVPLCCYKAVLKEVIENDIDAKPIPEAALFYAERAIENANLVEPSETQLITWGVPSTIVKILKPHQRKAIKFVAKNQGRALIADDMGLGKTLQAIASMTLYRNEWPMIVFCPAGAKSHWMDEFAQWLGNDIRVKELDGTAFDLSKVDVAICSVDSAAKYFKDGVIAMQQYRCVILDESHLIKTEATARSRVIVPFLRNANRVILLSGTPAFSRPEELWPQIHGIGMYWEDHENYLCSFCGKGLSNTRKHMLLYTMLSGTLMFRRQKQHCLPNLPSKCRFLFKFEPVDTSTVCVDDVRSVRANILSGNGQLAALSKQDDNILEWIKKNSDKESEKHLMKCYQNTGLLKVPKVVLALQEFLRDEECGKLCIFGHHKEVLDAIQHCAQLSKSNSIRIDCGVKSTSRRRALVNSFQNDPAIRVALLGLMSASTAITLTAGATVWFAELTWTPSIHLQAEDRIHRIGQQSNRLNYLYFIAEGTLDEDMWRLIKKKYTDIGEFINGDCDAKVVINGTHHSILEVVSGFRS